MLRRLVVVATIGALRAMTAAAGQHEHHAQMQEVAQRAAARIVIPDSEFTNQDGRKVGFYSDLVRDKVVVVNFVFTSCTTICPTMGINFGQLQSRIGPDVHLISVSIDPANDTPARLKSWGKRWNAGPRWTLLTGSQANVDALRKAFGVYTLDVASHTAITMVGDDRSGTWTRVDGLAPAARIAETVASVKAAKKVQR